MPLKRPTYRAWNDELQHRKNVVRKLQKVQCLQALIHTWQAQPQDTDQYRAYMRILKTRLRVAKTQYSNMQP
jgi:hypothetical protein